MQVTCDGLPANCKNIMPVVKTMFQLNVTIITVPGSQIVRGIARRGQELGEKREASL